MNANLAKVAALARTAPDAMRAMQEAAVRAAEFERRAMAVQRIIDAEGYVRLEDLSQVAERFGDPSAFMAAVNVACTSPVCQCWWCRLKRGVMWLKVRLRIAGLRRWERE